MNEKIIYKPIGYIRTPFNTIDKMPIQPLGAAQAIGTIELDPEFVAGLVDISGFSHLILIYHFHLVNGHRLSVVPFMDDLPHGIFATRAPLRPNPIGMSIVKLVNVVGNLLHIEGVDMVDGTPLLDIKPFFAKYDNRPDAAAGWLENKVDLDIEKVKSDLRFDSKKRPGI